MLPHPISLVAPHPRFNAHSGRRDRANIIASIEKLRRLPGNHLFCSTGVDIMVVELYWKLIREVRSLLPMNYFVRLRELCKKVHSLDGRCAIADAYRRRCGQPWRRKFRNVRKICKDCGRSWLWWRENEVISFQPQAKEYKNLTIFLWTLTGSTIFFTKMTSQHFLARTVKISYCVSLNVKVPWSLF